MCEDGRSDLKRGRIERGVRSLREDETDKKEDGEEDGEGEKTLKVHPVRKRLLSFLVTLVLSCVLNGVLFVGLYNNLFRSTKEREYKSIAVVVHASPDVSTAKQTNETRMKLKQPNNKRKQKKAKAISSSLSIEHMQEQPWKSVKKSNKWCVPPTLTDTVTIDNLFEDRHEDNRPPEGFIPKGLIYVKIPKSASSTAAGVAYRIASNVGARVLNTTVTTTTNIIHNNNQDNAQSILRKKSLPCQIFAHHGRTSFQRYGERAKRNSYLWSMIRHPTSRTMSAYFFSQVSRLGLEPTNDSFSNFLNEMQPKLGPGKWGFSTAYLATQAAKQKNTKKKKKKKKKGGRKKATMETFIRSILNEYDFVGVAERFDESVVVLRLLLDLPPGDILYLNSKSSASGYDDKCNKLHKPVMSEKMKKFFLSKKWTEGMSMGDLVMYDMVNAKLNATIASLGEERFRMAMEEHLRLQQQVAHQCVDKTVFPCMGGVNRTEEAKEHCYWNDNGCGYPCIDEMLRSEEIHSGETAVKSSQAQ